MALKVEIDRLISSLPNIGFYKPVVECVTNSLEAGARNICVELFSAPKEGSALTDDRFISKVVVVDDGEGFTEENLKAFKEYRTKRKLRLGCKGVGRLTWLKVFTKAEIESIYPVNGTFRKRRFVFDEDFDITSKPHDSDVPKGTVAQQTSITLAEVRDAEHKSVPEDIDRARDVVLTELLPKLLLQEHDVTITFRVNQPGVPMCRIETSDLPKLMEKKFPVTVDSEQEYFVLRYWLPDKNTPTSLPAKTYAFYCANKRTVEPFSEKGLTVNLSKSEGQYGIFLVESALFDAKVDDTRNKIAIDEANLYNRITWDHVNEALRPILQQIVYDRWPVLREEGEQDKARLAEDHPHLAVYIRAFNPVGRVAKDEALKHATGRLENVKKEVRKKYEHMLRKHKMEDTDVEEFSTLAECTTELGRQELAEYIWYRQVVIDVMQRLLGRKERHEKVIHNLIMPMRTKDKERVEDNNLWLLDDKFSLYQYAASECQVDDIWRDVCGDVTLQSECAGGDNRPDLFMFFSDTTESDDDLEAVIIELKKFSADHYQRSKGLDQLPLYASALKKRHPNFKRFWLYLIVDEFDEQFRELLRLSRSYRPFFSHDGEVYLQYNDEINAYVAVLTAGVLAANAKARNHRFLDIVKAGKAVDGECV